MAFGDGAELAFTLKVKGGPAAVAEVQRDAAQIEAATKKVNVSSQLSLAEQGRAVESLQRQRSSSILSIMRAMEGDVGKSAAATEKTHNLTDRLILDSQRAIAQAERSAAGAVASVEKVGARIAVAEQEAAGLAGQWSSLGAIAGGPLALGIAAAGAALVGLGALVVKFISDTTEAGDQLYDLSQQTNFSVESLSALKNSAETSGSSLEKIVPSLAIFNKNLGATGEEGGKVNEVLSKLNVTATDQEGVFRQVFKALYDLRGTYQQNEYAQALFGRGAKDLLGIINQSEGSFDALIGRYRELDTLITTEAARDAQDYKDKMAEVRQQIAAVEFAIGRQLLPTAMRALSSISSALKENKREFTEWSGVIVETTGGVWDLLKPFRDLEGLMLRAVAATNMLTLALKSLKDVGDYFRGPHVEGKIDASSLGVPSGERGLYSGRGVNVPESLRYKPKISDAALLAAAIGRDQKAREEAEKQAETESKQAREKAEKEEERQANIVRQIAKAYGEVSTRVSGFNRDALQLEASLYKLSIGYSTLSEANKKLAQEQINLLFSGKRELQRLEATDAVRKSLNASIDKAQQAARGEKTHVEEVVEALAKFTDAGGKADETTRKLAERALRFAQVRDDIEHFERLEKALDGVIEKSTQLEALGAPGVDLSTLPKNVLKGPIVSPEDIAAMGEPPAPKFDLWKQSLNGLKDVGKGVFGSLTQGFGSMVQAFLMGEKGAAKSFGAIAKAAISSMAAQAAVSALFQLAEGLAWLFINPPKAAAHFQSAAVFGIVAGMAGAASALIPGGGASTGSAFAGGGGAGGFGSSTSDSGPRVIEQSRNTVIEHVHVIRLEPGLVVEHVTQDVRGNGKLRGLIIETAAA